VIAGGARFAQVFQGHARGFPGPAQVHGIETLTYRHIELQTVELAIRDNRLV
jgi:hypothetical protein